MQQVDTNPARWRERVLVLLNEQIDLYSSLESLSARQAGLIRDEDTDSLLDVLTQRQRLIEKAQRVAEELTPYRRRWSDLLDALPALERDALNAKVNEATRLVDAIAARDEQDRQAMEQQRTQIATRIRDVTTARGAVAAYAGATTKTTDARYQDREG